MAHQADQPKERARRSSSSRALIWDIAREAGTSIATVSRALNGKAEVAPATRDHILHIAQAKGYISGQQAHSLVGRRLIGFTVPEVRSSYFVEIMEGAADALETYEASLVVCPTAYQSERERSLLERLLHNGVDGALLLVPSESNAELLQLQQGGYPFVVISPAFAVPDQLLVVTSTDMAGGRQATEYLLSLGHRRIGIITGPSDWCATIDRLAGYHAVLTSAGMAIDPTLTVRADFTVEGGLQAARRLFDLPDPPTAIFALNDDMAVGTLRAAEERGLRVPEDVSIIGFDDAIFASYTTPSLTSVRQPMRELSRAGVDLLFRKMQGQSIEARRIELSTQLIIRRSTGPVPEHR